MAKENISLRDYLIPKLRSYEKKPFYAYPIFLLILIPHVFKDQIEAESLYDWTVCLAFVTSAAMIFITFWLIYNARKKTAQIEIKVKIEKGNAEATIVRNPPTAKTKTETFSLNTTNINLIIDEISKKSHLTNEQVEEVIDFEIKDGGEHPPPTIDHYKEKQLNASKIFAVLYGLVAALAITNGLDAFMDEGTIFGLPFLSNYTQNFASTDSLPEVVYLIVSEEFFLLLSFFIVGTFFYHCGLVFFSEQAGIMLSKNRPHFEIVLSGAILFAEGLFLYLVAASIDSIRQFALWVFFLMAIDLAWAVFNSSYLKKGYAQWIHFNLITLIFVLAILLSYGNAQMEPAYHHHLIFFLVVLCRIVVDYKLSWNIFGEFNIK